MRPLAVVTGASSGIGAAFAERLAHDGYDLILIARRQERLISLAGRLQTQHQAAVHVIVGDLSRRDGLRRAEEQITRETAVELLVNNAGFGGFGPFVELDPDRAEDPIALHILAVTRLTRAVLPSMIERKHGAIINVSSRLSFSAPLPSPPLPRRATYAATKAYINTFTQILSTELVGTGVRVQALCPSIVRTEFFDVTGAPPPSLPGAVAMTPEDVVTASLAAIELGEVLCMPTLSDPTLLEEIDDSQRRIFQASNSGTLADRYRLPIRHE